MPEKLDKHTLNNGMVVLGEPMENVASASFNFLLQCGASTLPEGCCGASNLITDWLFRGAGKRDSRQLVDALDGLGLHRNSNTTSSHISLSASMEASNLSKAIDIYSDIIISPLLDARQFELSKQLSLSEVMGLDDDPRTKVLLKLAEQFYPDPFGRPAVGRIEDLNNLTPAGTAEILKERFNLSKAIFSVAGKYDFDSVCAQMEKLFDLPQPAFPVKIKTKTSGSKYLHDQYEGAQVHIGLMTKTVPMSSPDYYNAMAAVSVLSGGMSSRLFTEVREKRGLCYAVGANYRSLKDYAGISCYAGTTPDKAQETFDVVISEFDRLRKDITQDETQRAKVGLKSSLIMQSESSSSRAGTIASDYYLFGRVRPIEEVKEKLQQLTADSIKNFLNNNKFEDYTVVTIGPKKIKA
ncbi:MAG: insulinase family protein [Sedimentisphaerales bacterium]|nr:insulinase family protein [Sedimentisphaerales bacterium]